MALKVPCPTGKKPKGAKPPQVFTDPAAQAWYERNHGRENEAPPTRMETISPYWQRFVAGLTRQYEFLPQGGRFQGVRAALDSLKRAGDSSEMRELFNLQDAYGKLTPEQRSNVDAVYLARDLDASIRDQNKGIAEQEAVKLQGRKERLIDRFNRQRDDLMAQVTAEGKRLEQRQEGMRKSIARHENEIKRLIANAAVQQNAGDRAGAKRFEKRARALDAEIGKLETRIKTIDKQLDHKRTTAPDRMAAVDKREVERLKKEEERTRQRIADRQQNAPIVGALQKEGMDLGSAQSMIADARRIEQADPSLKAAIDRDRALEGAVVDERKALQRELFGFEPDLNREDYLHHEMLMDDAARNGAGGASRLSGKSVLRAFYTLQRKGTSLRYNTNTFEAKQRVYARMIADNARLRALKEIKAHDIGPKIVEQALKDAQAAGGLKPGEMLDLDAYIPDTHVRFSPDKGTDITQFWDAQARYVERLAAANFDRMGLTPGQNKQDLYLTHLQDWVIPKEIAETLAAVVKPFDPTHEAFLNRMARGATSFWKVGKLYFPHSFAKYSLGNFADDTTSAYKFTSVKRHPHITKTFLKRAAPEVMGFLFGKRQASPEYREFLLRAGTDGQQLRAELGIQDLEGTAQSRIARALSAPLFWRRMIGGPWQMGSELQNAYMARVMRIDGAREHLWRFTLFLDYLDQMQKSADGRPGDYGTSIPDEVLALDNLYDRAYHLSNDVMGAYDKTTAFGRWVADHVIPFWRYQEQNHRRHYRYLANQTRDVMGAAKAGRSVAASLGLAARGTPLMMARLGAFAVKMAAIDAALTAYNNARFPDAEESLDEKERQKPHLITGYDPRTGEVQYIRNLGANPDFYALFGLMDNARLGKRWLDGEITAREAATKALERDGQTLLESFGPWRTVALLLHGIQQTRGGKVMPVRDPVEKILGETMGPWAVAGYRKLNEIPQRPFSARKMIQAGADIHETAYYHTLDRLGDFRRQMDMGGSVGGGPYSEKQNALYWYRQAKRWGDDRLAQKYGAQYVLLADQSDGYQNMVESMSPIGRLSQMQVQKWLGTLDMPEKRMTLRAMLHWSELFAPKYDLGADIESNLKDAPADVRRAITKAPGVEGAASLAKLLDTKREGLPAKTGERLDESLSFLLTYLHARVVGDAALEALSPGGITDLMMKTPGVMEGRVERALKKSGVE